MKTSQPVDFISEHDISFASLAMSTMHEVPTSQRRFQILSTSSGDPKSVFPALDQLLRIEYLQSSRQRLAKYKQLINFSGEIAVSAPRVSRCVFERDCPCSMRRSRKNEKDKRQPTRSVRVRQHGSVHTEYRGNQSEGIGPSALNTIKARPEIL